MKPLSGVLLCSALLSVNALAQTSAPLPVDKPAPQGNPATPTGLAAPLPSPVPISVRNPAAPLGPSVTTRVAQGVLEGVNKAGVNYFLGVPYAAAPTGEARWQPPRPVIPWTGKRNARQYGNICPQHPSPLDPDNDNKLYGNEDCLFVDVYTPQNAKNAPVMFWVHGGSFDSGSANQYNGSELARRYGVVVVSAEYRLGALGFLAASALGEGNYGLLDIQAALKWTQQNAQAFGGDGRNITVFGESAGSMAICTLLAAPSSQGLFQKAIMQSGPCSRGIGSAPLEQVRKTGDEFVKQFNCVGNLAANCMRGQSVDLLLNTPLPGTFIPGQVKLPPVYGGQLVPTEPLKAFAAGKVLKLPLLIGTNRDEGTPFTAYLTAPNTPMGRTLYFGLVSLLNAGHATEILQQYPSRNYATPALAGATLVTDGLFACPVNDFGRLYSAYAPTYRYEFSDPKAASSLRPTASIPTLGAFHASELVYVFGTPLYGLADPAKFSPQQALLSRQMGQYWTNFARTGNPNGSGLTQWPSHSTQNRAVLTLAPNGNKVSSQFAQEHQCDFWASINAK